MKRILIVDDDDQIREMLCQMLRMEGYEVVDARNGKEALKLYREKPTDLIITDLIMPEKEGIETIREMKQDYPEAKIIAMSGGGVVGPDAYLRIAKGLGAKLTFMKPIPREDLLQGIREVLEEK